MYGLDLHNKRFGKLIAIKVSHKNKFSRNFWLCRCDCGKNKIIRASILQRGRVTSLMVAKSLGRNYIGIELNPKYIEMAEKRILDGYNKKNKKVIV